MLGARYRWIDAADGRAASPAELIVRLAGENQR
jgi:hypothetical protein